MEQKGLGGVGGEVADTLELHPATLGGVGQGRFELGIGDELT